MSPCEFHPVTAADTTSRFIFDPGFLNRPQDVLRAKKLAACECPFVRACQSSSSGTVRTTFFTVISHVKLLGIL
jgi:hypothetical protein